MALKKGKYQYKRVAFEITDATTLKDLKPIFDRYPELKKVVSDNDKQESSSKRKSKTKPD